MSSLQNYDKLIKFVDETIILTKKNNSMNVTSLLWWCILWNFRMIFCIINNNIGKNKYQPKKQYIFDKDQPQGYYTLKKKNIDVEQSFDAFMEMSEDGMNSTKKTYAYDFKEIEDMYDSALAQDIAAYNDNLTNLMVNLLDKVVSNDSFRKSILFKNLMKMNEDYNDEKKKQLGFTTISEFIKNCIIGYDISFFTTWGEDIRNMECNIIIHKEEQEVSEFSIPKYNNFLKKDEIIGKANQILLNIILEELDKLKEDDEDFIKLKTSKKSGSEPCPGGICKRILIAVKKNQ